MSTYTDLRDAATPAPWAPQLVSTGYISREYGANPRFATGLVNRAEQFRELWEAADETAPPVKACTPDVGDFPWAVLRAVVESLRDFFGEE